jgi:DNA polymerase type B, organellar and viral
MTPAEKRYRASPAGRALKKRYRASPAGRAEKARSRKQWKASPGGRAAKARERADRAKSRQISRKLKAAERDRAPFVGCDGEGMTIAGCHKYTLFRMGDRELIHNDQRRLTSPELLSFILDHPNKTDILVGFAFEYDVTSILIDLPAERRAHLIATYQQKHAPGEKRKDGGKRWTWVDFEGYGRFGINWLARNHLKVCRPSSNPKNPNGADRATIRTICDTWGFFAMSFLKSIQAWDVGREHWATIEAHKNERADFAAMTPEIRRYNEIECDLLSQMMGKFRTVCFEADIRPKTWNGAGKIAAFLHHQNGTLRAKQLAKLAPAGLIRMAHAGYYGGRFEITRVGLIAQTVWEQDINSAYPDAMRSLPCLDHGAWRWTNGAVLAASPPGSIYICPIRFSHPREQFLCGLPFRAEKDGRLSWPRFGNGVYWSPEIRSAEKLGATCEHRAGWLYEKRCDCHAFKWVETRYAQRKALPKPRDEPLKRGINSLYGKLAQRIGEPPFANPIWAGLTTAATRAKLNAAIAAADDPRDVVMLATDGVYSLKPLKLKAGGGLGQWGVKDFPSLFVVQPGLYWPPRSGDDWRPKSRGISPTTIAKFSFEFEAAWFKFAGEPSIDAITRAARLFDALELGRVDLVGVAIGDRYPLVEVSFPAFIGLRLAAHWGRPEAAGQWLPQTRKISFDWRGKRDADGTWDAGRKVMILDPLRGDGKAVSAHYEESGALSTAESWEAERMLFEAMPDAAELIEMFVDDPGD